jgi:hypothetical protein
MLHKTTLSELVLVCSATPIVHIKFKPSSLHATERLAALIVTQSSTELESVHLVKAENYYYYYYYNFPEIIKKLLRK